MHSWSPPVASKTTTTKDSTIGFEVKVLLDGSYTAGTVFDAEHTWPRIIDSTLQVDEHGKQEQLRFPAFHSEMLHQTFVDPAQNMGRIRVVITEGGRQSSDVSVFEKTKTLVVFSFQHTPLHILQDTGIAWPNHAMYYQASEQMYNPLSPPKTIELDPDSHAHSPRHQRQAPSPTGRTRVDAKRCPPRLPHEVIEVPFPRRPLLHDQADVSHSWCMHDPFVGSMNPSIPNSWRNLTRNSSKSNDIMMTDHNTLSSSSRDQSMPDYSHSISPTTLSLRSYALPDNSRPISPASLRSELIADYSRPISLINSRQPSDFEQTLSGAKSLSREALAHDFDLNDQRALSCLDSDAGMREGHFNDPMAAHDSRMVPSNGTLAPANTRVSSAANTPTAGTRPSAAAKARASSYNGVPQRVVSVTVRDAASPMTCSAFAKNQNSSSASHQAEIYEERSSKSQPVIRKKPSMKVKGKKEGRTSEIGLSTTSQWSPSTVSVGSHEKENHQTSKTRSTTTGGSKRRRISNAVDLSFNLEARSRDGSPILRKPVQDDFEGNPSLKINEFDDLTTKGVVVRPPLELLDNII